MDERLPRVLVVDDSEDDHLQLRRLFKTELTIVPAYSAAEALERLSHDVFDALITDEKMPRMTGNELIRVIKADERTRSLPCILLSGKTSDVQLVEILRGGGVFHYFEKNNTLLTRDGRTELMLAVRNAVQQSRLERDRAELTGRLRTQVEALSSQYQLLRTLLDVREPMAILDRVVESLAAHLGCLGVVGMVDLQPGQGAFLTFAGRGRQSAGTLAGEDDARLWEAFAQETYQRLSGRHPGEMESISRLPAKLPAGGHLPPPRDPPYLPVFVNRDLRGLLVVLRDGPLEAEEHELMRIWRDVLQDALGRAVTQHMNEHRRLELMVEAMNEGIVMTDETGTVTVMNPALRRLLGLSVGERPDFAVILQALGLSSVEILREFGPGETRTSWREVRLAGADCLVTFSPVHNQAGAFVGWLAVIRDVTEQKASDARRDEFMHTITHEIRSPMTSIVGVLDLLGKQVLGELTEHQRSYVEMARESCTRINTHLNELLDLAKFERGKMELNLEPVHLDRLVVEAARVFGAAAIERRIHLIVRAAVEGLVSDADAYRLTQVINNLVSNGLKFTPPGGTLDVSVHSPLAVPDRYLVTVRNTGEEIPEKDLERIFDKFEQVTGPDHRRSVGGTGLGLTICRSIVEAHGGTVWAESGQGEGTAFVFTLPTREAREQYTVLAGEHGPGRAPREGTQPILVLADDWTEGLAVKAALLSQGFSVRLGRPDPDRLAARIAAVRPALVVYVEPDGEPRLLSELLATAGLPVVALVAPGTRLDAPLDATLEVPIEAGTLAGVLDLVLLRQRQRRRMRVLVCDRDPFAAGQWAQLLDEAGYLAYTAHLALDAVRRLDILLPDLVLVDVGMPGSLSILDRLQHEEGGLRPLVMVDNTPLDQAADPWPALPVLGRDVAGRELLLRVRAQLASDTRSQVDALIILPGPRELEREVHGRIRDAQAFAYCAIDIEGLREAVEAFGFMWGHNVMTRTAELVRRVVRERGGAGAFLGHQRDDDFVFLVHPDGVDVVWREITRAFDRVLSIIVEDAPGTTLRLQLTAVVDDGGRFERYASIQSALNASRRRTGGQSALIDRDPDRRTLS